MRGDPDQGPGKHRHPHCTLWEGQGHQCHFVTTSAHFHDPGGFPSERPWEGTALEVLSGVSAQMLTISVKVSTMQAPLLL